MRRPRPLERLDVFDSRDGVPDRVVLDFVMEIVRRTGADPDFKVLPRRWVLERTFGWLIPPAFDENRRG